MVGELVTKSDLVCNWTDEPLTRQGVVVWQFRSDESFRLENK